MASHILFRGGKFSFGMAMSLFVTARVLTYTSYTFNPTFVAKDLDPTFELLYGLAAPLALGCGALYILDLSNALRCELRLKILEYFPVLAVLLGTISLGLLKTAAQAGLWGPIAMTWLFIGGHMLSTKFEDVLNMDPPRPTHLKACVDFRRINGM